MKLIIFLVSIAFIVCFNSFSQKLELGFQSGIGTYAMDDLAKLNELSMQSLPFDTKIVSAFPPYLYFQPSIMFMYKRYSIGLVYNYYSTGSRVSGKDYSGEYRFDMTTFAHSPGVFGSLNLFKHKALKCNLYSTIGFTKSVLKLNDYLSLGDTVVNSDNLKLDSHNFYFEPGIKLSYSFHKIEIGLHVGFSFHFKSEPFYYMERGNNLTIGQDKIKPDWSGYRLGVSVANPIEIFDLW